ncbi:MAG: hypothetical protein Q8L39_10580 [Burkholderiales bacterium]|nr:hypothetical protein [Burkholderiales bacterium]
MNRHTRKTLAAHRWPVAASLAGDPVESPRRVFPPQAVTPLRNEKARVPAGLVKHFDSHITRLAGLLVAASVTSGAAVAIAFLLVMRLIGGAP